MKKSLFSKALFAIGAASLMALLLSAAWAAPPWQTQPQVQPAGSSIAGGQPAVPAVDGTTLPLAAVQDPGLSVVLVIDVSGSMRENNKMRDAKQAALESIARYLTPDLGQQPTLPSVSLPPQIRPPAVSLAEAAKLDSFRELVTELQKLQGKAGNPPGHLVSWTTTDMQDMRKLMDKMDELMQGVALEKKQGVLKLLDPLIEKMHFAIEKKVNASLNGGHFYMVSGKKSNHPDFGGLYANKMSDHDAIYVVPHANEAKKRHARLAEQFLESEQFPEKGWLQRTDSAMESGEATFRHARTRAARQADFKAFETALDANNDWMRTVSGGGWVSEYVVEKGEVIKLDALRANPDEARQTLKQMIPQLKANGLSFDARGPSNLGYNFGAVSDFDRQYMLNLHRRKAAGWVARC